MAHDLSILHLLCGLQLPIDVELFERREQLKKSGLGKVFFFSKIAFFSPFN
jgi:hypothetical protein